MRVEEAAIWMTVSSSWLGPDADLNFDIRDLVEASWMQTRGMIGDGMVPACMTTTPTSSSNALPVLPRP